MILNKIVISIIRTSGSLKTNCESRKGKYKSPMTKSAD